MNFYRIFIEEIEARAILSNSMLVEPFGWESIVLHPIHTRL